MKIKDKIINWLWRYANKYSSEETEEDFIEFLEDYKKRLNKIKEVYHPKDNDELKQISLAFNNVYTQRQMVQANKNLSLATWVLAFATIAFSISTIWGQNQALKAVTIGLQIVFILFIIAIVSGILTAINDRILRPFVRFILIHLIKEKNED